MYQVCKLTMDTPRKIFYNFVLLVIICLKYSSISDASCVLPEDLKNTVWEYNYTDVTSNSKQSTNLYIANTTLPDSVINLNAEGTIINNWTCINSINISNTTNVVVFKSDSSFPRGGNRQLYLCMKLTKVTTDLFYFYLLSDIKYAMFPNERVFISESGNTPADNTSICSTFCHYTDSPTIRTLRRQGSSANLPSNVSLCEPCGSACKEATTIITSIETTRTTSMPLTSIDIDSTTYMTATETTQKISVQSDSTDIDSTIKIISTTTTPKTTLPATATEMDTTIQLTSTETVVHSSLKVTTTDLKDETTLDTKSTVSGILNHYTALIISGGLIISGLLVVIAICCLIKERKRDPPKYTSTNVTNRREEEVSHIYSEPSEVYHEYSEPSEVYHEYSEPS